MLSPDLCPPLRWQDLKNYFDSSATTSTVLNCLPPCWFILPWIFERGTQEVVARHAHRFRGGFVVVNEKNGATPRDELAMNTDQYGVAPLWGRQNWVVWPPPGYNVILQVSRELGPQVRARWPPGAPARPPGAPATNLRDTAAVPAQLSIPARELSIPSASVPGAGVHGGAAAGAGRDPVFCGGCGDALGGKRFCQGCGESAGM
jgi:hypothetical protein